jgi:hypothetical protein
MWHVVGFKYGVWKKLSLHKTLRWHKSRFRAFNEMDFKPLIYGCVGKNMRREGS